MTQDEAVAYWADKPFKKYVVTLERGPRSKPERETKYIGSRNGGSAAIACAKANAMVVKNPTRVSCRLATAFDLGCSRTEA
jgi:hypothetical protein